MSILGPLSMGEIPRWPEGAKRQQGTGLIVCMMRRGRLREGMFDQLMETIESELGSVRMLVPELQGWIAPWQYRIEMGQDLVNVGVVLEEEHPVVGLVAFKRWALAMERETSVCGKRTLNLNPGLVLPDRVIVASHKPRGRIRLRVGRDCWTQEVATAASTGKFIPSCNTFSEYLAPTRLQLFGAIRTEELTCEFLEESRRCISVHDVAHNEQG